MSEIVLSFGTMQYIISNFKAEKMNQKNWDLMKLMGKIHGSLEIAYLFSMSSNFNLLQRELMKWLELTIEYYNVVM